MSALIIAPFWRLPGHVGNYRVDRFVRWLKGANVDVTLVRAGSTDNVEAADWGTEITIADPLKIYTDQDSSSAPSPSPRKPNRLRRLFAYAVFSPDLTIVWAKRAARHQSVLEHGKNASFVLSSSPPESSHIVASILARHFSIPLIVDMRDGWLDEPLKPLLRTSRLQRWREARLEKAILKQAESIFVTSTVWKEMLGDRWPFTRAKTTVLTNAYPNTLPQSTPVPERNPSQPLLLVHAGRFTGSSPSRRAGLLLKPIHDALNQKARSGEILLIGGTETGDLEEINEWSERFSRKGWTLTVKPFASRDKLINILAKADGLLLLSTSRAAIPSKLFEYIPMQKPILAATYPDSAVWELSHRVPQIVPFDCTNGKATPQVARFLESAHSNGPAALPNEFSELHLSTEFLRHLPIRNE